MSPGFRLGRSLPDRRAARLVGLHRTSLAERESTARSAITLRCGWREFPTVRGLTDRPMRDALWGRLVRLRCEELYDLRRRMAVVA